MLEFDRVIFSGLVLSVEGGESLTLDDTLVSDSVHGLYSQAASTAPAAIFSLAAGAAFYTRK